MSKEHNMMIALNPGAKAFARAEADCDFFYDWIRDVVGEIKRIGQNADGTWKEGFQNLQKAIEIAEADWLGADNE